MGSAPRPRVIVGVGGRGAHPRVVRTAVSLARGTGAVLYAVDVRDERMGDERMGDERVGDERVGNEKRHGPPAMQDAYRALSRAGADDVDTRIVVVNGRPGETLLRLADRPDDLLVLGRSRRDRGDGATPGPVAWRCATRARCPVVIVPCDPAESC